MLHNKSLWRGAEGRRREEEWGGTSNNTRHIQEAKRQSDREKNFLKEEINVHGGQSQGRQFTAQKEVKMNSCLSIWQHLKGY